MLSVDKFVTEIRAKMEAEKHDENAVAMAAYMKNRFEFLGIKKDHRVSLSRDLISVFSKQTPDQIQELVKVLWALPHREYQYVAIELLFKYKKHITKGDIQLFEGLITQKSWWDTVDHLATHMVGAYFLRFPEEMHLYLDRWNEGGNIWLIRTGILFQLKYKENTNIELLFSLCEMNAHQQEFFIAKAIGWALRELAKTEPRAVKRFVENTPLQNLSKREALKHLI